MHREQQDFCERVKNSFPEFFKNVSVVDFGSLDINGSNCYLFEGGRYLGIDIGPGKNVDLICRAHEYNPEEQHDTVISTEMLEHDEFWEKSLEKMYEVARPGGLVFFTCATTGRLEHGTRRTTPGDAPFVGDYYRNLTEGDVRSVWRDMDKLFSTYHFEVGPPADLRFYGIKNTEFPND